jgi:DNA-binding response OmpR family regulator
MAQFPRINVHMPKDNKLCTDGSPLGSGLALIVFVSSSGADAQAFRQIVGSSGQLVVNVPDLCGAIAVIERRRPDLVVCDTEIEGEGSWRNLLEMRQIDGMLSLMVVSPDPDDCLRADVLNLGGLGVLARPFRSEEVKRFIEIWQKIFCQR